MCLATAYNIKDHDSVILEYVSKIEVDGDKVILTDATKLEFRNNGQWKKVESKHGIVPVGIVPPPIQAYIDENFPVCGVSELKHGRRSYEVELNNGIDLTFDDSDFFLTDYDD